MLYNYCSWEGISCALHQSRGKKHITFQQVRTTGFDFMINTSCSYISFIRLHMIQLVRNNRTLFWFITHSPKHTAHMHTRLQKILPRTHHTHLHTHTIINMMILPHTHIHKIQPRTHYTHLHTHMVIHKKILMLQTVTHTRHCYSYKKLSRYPHLPQIRCTILRKKFIVNASWNGTTSRSPI